MVSNTTTKPHSHRLRWNFALPQKNTPVPRSAQIAVLFPVFRVLRRSKNTKLHAIQLRWKLAHPFHSLYRRSQRGRVLPGRAIQECGRNPQISRPRAEAAADLSLTTDPSRIPAGFFGTRTHCPSENALSCCRSSRGCRPDLPKDVFASQAAFDHWSRRYFPWPCIDVPAQTGVSKRFRSVVIGQAMATRARSVSCQSLALCGIGGRYFQKRQTQRT